MNKTCAAVLIALALVVPTALSQEADDTEVGASQGTSEQAAVHIQKGLGLGRDGDYGDALREFESALRIQQELNAVDPRLLNAIGWTEFLRGNIDRSERHLIRALALSEHSDNEERDFAATVLNNLGLLYIYKEDTENAREALTRAAELYGSETARKNLSLLGRVQKADPSESGREEAAAVSEDASGESPPR